VSNVSARILARKSVSVSASWNAGFTLAAMNDAANITHRSEVFISADGRFACDVWMTAE